MPGSPLRLFLRIVSKNKEVYLLKIITLSIAFASSTLVIVFSLNEFGYDRYHVNADSVFRIIQRNASNTHNGNRLSNNIPYELYQKLASESKDSLVVSRVKIMNGVTVFVDKKATYDYTIHSIDPEITNIFSFDIIQGSLNTFLENDHQVLLSASAAQLYFGTIQASGNRIRLHSVEDTLQFSVAGIYEDFPQNSHEKFDLLILFDTTSIQSLGFNAREGGVYGRAIKADLLPWREMINAQVNHKDRVYKLQPLPQVYFGPRVLGEHSRHGDSYSILLLICITGLILFLALSSYVNLTTLTLPHRSKELAVKKLAGTNHFDLLFTFSRESFIIVLVSFAIGLLLLVLTSDLIEPILSIHLFSLLLHGDMTLFSVMAGVLATLIVAPLFLTSKFIRASPVRLLSTEKITFPRFKRVISVLQLGTSIFLIVSSMVIKRQINHSLLKEPGRNYEQIVYLNYPDGLTNEGLLGLRSAWRKSNPNIVDVIATSQLPDRISSKEINSPFYFLTVDPYFPHFFKLNMIQGNWFKANAGDSIFVLNKKGLEYLRRLDTKNVIGVMDDMSTHFNQPQKPLKFRLATLPSHYNYLCVRILEVDIRNTIHYLSSFFDGAPISLLDDRFDEWIKYQDRLNNLSALLAIISGLLSCCAIYGLSVSMVRDKIKQIAIHKICGANTLNITIFLAREFVKSALIAIIIFGPLTYIFIRELLRNFVYSTHFQWQDPVYPFTYCAIVIFLLCSLQALSLNRRDLTLTLKN